MRPAAGSHHHRNDNSTDSCDHLLNYGALSAGVVTRVRRSGPMPAAIAKTVEAQVRSIFTKLNLTPDAGDHRRVLVVLALLRS